MTEAMLHGKKVELIGEAYEGPKIGEHAGRRQWTMVRQCGTKTWKPAWMDELKEVPSDD
jgi:hypothetical protein